MELAPGLAAARLNRGILAYRNGRFAEAISDFDRGLAAEPDRETSGRLRFNLALAQLRSHDRQSAHSNAAKAVDLGCSEAAVLLEELR
jgi:Tfp pilus assembly protein PilF